MKVLFICHRFPYPPRRGGKIRPFNIIRHLHLQGHAVTAASLVRDAAEEQAAAGIADYCARFIAERISPSAAAGRMLRFVPSARPSSFGYFHSPALHRRIRELLAREPFDLILVHCSSAAPYAAGAAGVPRILDFGDMDSQKWRDYSAVRGFPLNAAYWLEWRKLERVERRYAREFDLTTCTTRAELATLGSLADGRDCDWFPNGVDAEHFAPDGTSYDADTICFVGRMDYFPNQQAVLTFCNATFPLIRARRPNARFLIVGAAPSGAILNLGQRPGVQVTGTVEDVRPWVQQAAVSIAPLAIARGTQNKILESLAMGVPVVVSPAAAGGVDAVDGEHLLIADDPAAFAAAVLRLLEQPTERERLARAGRERMLTHHSWAASMRRLDALIARVLVSAGSIGASTSVAERAA